MISHTEATPFELRGPLPSGITVLEASAGTGKTYAIAALAARYVAEGTPLERLLLVTFTRMATGELRERVRDRLLSVERDLDLIAGRGEPEGPDEVVELLAEGTRAEIRERRDRLRRALADFDSATIATTHGFCQEILGGLGIAGDLEPDTAFVEEIDDLLGEVVDDLYVRRFKDGDERPFNRSEAARIARAAVNHPAVALVPADEGAGGMRYRLAEAVRDELERRKRRLAVITYDDLLTRLDGALAGPGAEAAARRLRERYRVVLVDEFQDTDPVQWRILRRAFGGDRGDGGEGTTVVLIGDPKQAIYAFRGADVYAYLEAATLATARHTLDTNWRSDRGLIEAYDALFANALLGHEGIAYRRVRAAPANQEPGLVGAPEPAPLRVRIVDREDPGIQITNAGLASKDSARKHVAEDVAADLSALLGSGATLSRRAEAGEAPGPDPPAIGPGDVAVLVRTNSQAALVRDALERAGIPAVINGAGSVFATEQAGEWLRLLEALERPSARTRARSAAITCFFGWSAERAAAADEAEWEAVHGRLHELARVLREHGVAALAEWISLLERLPERILARPDGERQLTDLRHIGQLLHQAASEEQLGAAALRAWLRRRIEEAEQDTQNEERSRRLESDAAAVQVLTIHRSKGLEFPLVYAPFLWDTAFKGREARPVLFHDPEAENAPAALDVSLEGEAYERHREQGLIEERGEDLRLAYVALTRARHQAVIWWAAATDSRDSPLGRLLFARDERGNVAAEGEATPSDEVARERFEGLAARARGRIAVEHARHEGEPGWGPPPSEPPELSAASFERGLDWGWRRTSYSDITAGAFEAARVTSEPEETTLDDEPAEPEPQPAPAEGPAEPDAALPVPLAGMPVGRELGTLVHRVLEETDFTAPDLDAELRAHLAAAGERGRVEIGDPEAAIAGLRAAIETPLGPLLGNSRLRDIPRTDRIDELGFELPLAGGDEPTGRLALAAIGELLRRQLPATDPLAPYAERLRDPALRREVRGYLTGFLDLVVRLPGEGADGAPRFAVLDHKTNWLAPAGEELTTWHHRPAALAVEMRRAHYGLQALLYAAALHRYLRWRLPGYDPERNFAGVGYLFLRGMVGPKTPVIDGAPCGVFAWRPPAPLLEALSDVLDGEEAAAA